MHAQADRFDHGDSLTETSSNVKIRSEVRENQESEEKEIPLSREQAIKELRQVPLVGESGSWIAVMAFNDKGEILLHQRVVAKEQLVTHRDLIKDPRFQRPSGERVTEWITLAFYYGKEGPLGLQIIAPPFGNPWLQHTPAMLEFKGLARDDLPQGWQIESEKEKVEKYGAMLRDDVIRAARLLHDAWAPLLPGIKQRLVVTQFDPYEPNPSEPLEVIAARPLSSEGSAVSGLKSGIVRSEARGLTTGERETGNAERYAERSPSNVPRGEAVRSEARETEIIPMTKVEAAEVIREQYRIALGKSGEYRGTPTDVRVLALSSFSRLQKFLLTAKVSINTFRDEDHHLRLRHKEFLEGTIYAHKKGEDYWADYPFDWTIIDFEFSGGELAGVKIMATAVHDANQVTDALAMFKGIDKKILAKEIGKKGSTYEVGVRDELIATSRVIYKALTDEMGVAADHILVETEASYFDYQPPKTLKELAGQKTSFDASDKTGTSRSEVRKQVVAPFSALRTPYTGIVRAVVKGEPVEQAELRRFVESARSELRETIAGLREALDWVVPSAMAEIAAGTDGFAARMKESVNFRSAHPEYEVKLSDAAKQSIVRMEQNARTYLEHNLEKSLHFAFAMPLPMPAGRQASGSTASISEWLLDYLRAIQSLKTAFGGRVRANIRILARRAQMNDGFVKAVQRSGLVKIVEMDQGAAPQLKRFLDEHPNAFAFDLQEMLGPQFAGRSVRLESVLWEDVYPIATPIVFQAAQVTQITADLLNKIPQVLPGNAVAFRKGQLVILETVRQLVLEAQAGKLFAQMA